MNTSSAQASLEVPGNPRGFVRRSVRTTAVGVFVSAALFAALSLPVFSRTPAVPQASQSSSISDVQCVIGCENIKTNSKGTLSVVSSGLEFSTKKDKADISTASIQDIFTGNQSRQDISGLGGTAVKAAIPYGGGRVLSLFSHKVEVLTVEYTDSFGGFHGAIFVLPAGQATSFKDQLVAQGAKVSSHVDLPAPEEQKP